MEKNSPWRNSPLSPSNWPAESFGLSETLLVALGAIGITLLTIFLSGIALRAGGTLQMAPGGGLKAIAMGPLLFLQLVFYIAVGVYLYFTVPRIARRSWQELGLRAPTWRDAGTGLIGACVMLIVVYMASLVVERVSHHEQEQVVVQMFRSLRDPRLLVLFGVFATVFAPIVEETVFRAFVFNAFLRRTGVLTAATLSGVLFGAAHFELFALFPLACGGVVLALTYYRTGCLWSSIIAHACFNSVELIGVLATNTSHVTK